MLIAPFDDENVVLYSPGAVGRYSTEQVPSLLSTQENSALEGPSHERARFPAPARSVTIVKGQGSLHRP